MNKFLDKIIVESNKVQVKIEQKENKLRKIYSKVLQISTDIEHRSKYLCPPVYVPWGHNCKENCTHGGVSNGSKSK